MNKFGWMLAVVTAACVVVPSRTMADESSDLATELEALRAQLQRQNDQIRAQRGEITQLRASSGESWMTDRRADEIRALIGEVLSDAETRASLQGDGMTAGHADGHFYIGSMDGNFLMRISGQSQTRYVYNDADDPRREFGPDDEDAGFEEERGGDDQVEGFQQRRTKVRLDGHVFDPKLTYAIQMNASFNGDEASHVNIGSAHDDDGGVFRLEDAWVGYEFADGWQVRIGQFKAPFLRDELVDSSHQLAAERAYVTDLLTVDYTQGVEVNWDGEIGGLPVRAAAMIHDGSYMGNTDYDNDTSDFAVAGRVDVLLAGTWSQFDDYTTWSSDEFGLMVGGAIDYESPIDGGSFPTSGSGATPGDFAEFTKWTIDVSAEFPELYGLNVFGAIVGQNVDTNSTFSSTNNDPDQWAFVLQAGVYIIPDKLDVFARWEHLDLDGVLFYNFDNFGAGQAHTFLPGTFDDEDDYEDELDIITIGMNYYMHGHAAKATVDLMWALDPVPAANTGVGVDANGYFIDHEDRNDDDQFTIRGQVQLLF